MATLLVGHWHLLWNQTAAKDSVHEDSCVEQIRQRGEAGLAVVGLGFGRAIGGSLPVAPTRGDERTAAIWKHHEQQQSAAALYGAHNR